MNFQKYFNEQKKPGSKEILHDFIYMKFKINEI